MGYSINFYQKGAIADKKVKEIQESSDPEAKRKIKAIIEEQSLPIMLFLRFAGQTVKVYTERKCTQKEWDNQRVNPRFYKKGAIELNRYLDKLEEETAKLHEQNTSEQVTTTREHLTPILDKCNNREHVPVVVTFEGAFAEFLEVKKHAYTESTLKKYRTTIKHLKAFSAKYRIKLHFEGITGQFESKLRDYLISELGMNNNTIAKYIKALKTFMYFCTDDRNYNSKLNLHFKKFTATEFEREVYALSVDELLRLYGFNFKNKGHERVRDVFCFMSFTGLRFSDVEKLKREDIKDGYISLLVKKTKKPVIIPLNQYAQTILAKYEADEKPLPVISNQKTNEALYEIGQLIELNELVKVINFIGAEVFETYVPKYEVLTTHIGRKTFITNSLILGMQERVVKEISGHKTEENFRRYVAFANTYKQEAMNDTWNPEALQKRVVRKSDTEKVKKAE